MVQHFFGIIFGSIRELYTTHLYDSFIPLNSWPFVKINVSLFTYNTLGSIYRLGIMRNNREKFVRQLKFSGLVILRMTKTMVEFVPQIS